MKNWLDESCNALTWLTILLCWPTNHNSSAVSALGVPSRSAGVLVKIVRYIIVNNGSV
jgi:hypothetical protein